MKHYFSLPVLFLFFGTLCIQCSTSKKVGSYESAKLKIERLTPNTFVHTSFLATQSFGKVPCNGMITIDKGEAIIFDTPTSDSVSLELIRWVEQNLKCTIKAIVATHFHVDCLGGLDAFHQKKIPSYANNLTIQLAKEKEVTVPQNGFAEIMEMSLGEEKVMVEYLGEGHTIDNVIAYVPKDKVLFGGCLVKSSGAGKGNLRDANVGDWPRTVAKLKGAYPEVKWVIPGHGKSAGKELLDYTIDLFNAAEDK